MKLMHLSDLHLGKRVNEFPMLEDQQYILTKIINIADEEKPDGVMIAGDVFDKSIPGEEAVQLWDDFLNRLVQRNIKVFIISGNHDSAVRVSEYNRLIRTAGVYISPAYSGEVTPVSLEDEHGSLNIYMLPYIKPPIVRSFFPEEKIDDYTDACRVAIGQMQVNPKERNVLITHQFVTGATRCESEEIVVGGLDNVDVSVFDAFDYVALGHIHGRQSIGRETVRYCGTPLKYSFSEKEHIKSVTIVELGAKNDITVRECPLTPRHDLREIRGTYEELTCRENYENTAVDDYIHAVLTDEEDVVDAVLKLRIIYPNLMKMSYDNKRTRGNQTIDYSEDVEAKSPLTLFETFYETQNNQPMSEEQKDFVQGLIQSIWG